MRRVRKKNWNKEQRAKPHTLTTAINAIIEEEEKKGKKNKKKERNRELDPNPATLDHLVTSDGPHGSNGGSILKLSHIHRGNMIFKKL